MHFFYFTTFFPKQKRHDIHRGAFVKNNKTLKLCALSAKPSLHRIDDNQS